MSGLKSPHVVGVLLSTQNFIHGLKTHKLESRKNRRQNVDIFYTRILDIVSGRC